MFFRNGRKQFNYIFLKIMSIFVHTNCQIVGDTAVNHLAWSNTNALLALSTYSIDENDRETNKVVIVNSEVGFPLTAFSTHFPIRVRY